MRVEVASCALFEGVRVLCVYFVRVCCVRASERVRECVWVCDEEDVKTKWRQLASHSLLSIFLPVYLLCLCACLAAGGAITLAYA